MKLKLVKYGHCDNWYSIERSEHDGRQWLEETEPNVLALRCSSRLSDADCEGPLAEMQALAKAIGDRQDAEPGRRCAVRFVRDHALFYSPRNSSDESCARVPLADADDLAVQILAAVAEAK